jgi:hypothetical protein
LPATTWAASSGIGTGGASTSKILSPKPGNPTDTRSYDHVYLTSGDYVVPDNGTIYVGTNVSVRLRVTTGSFSPNYLYVAGTDGTAGKMIAYVESATLGLGSDDMTQSGRAANMIFLGLPSCTSLSYKGNGDFTGAMYAPEADFQLAGGGSGIIDFIGSSVTKTVQMNGHYHFHYDEDLRRLPLSNGYIATNWREL